MNSRWNPNSKWRKISEFVSKVNPMNYIPRRSGQNASRPSNVELIDLGQDISNNAGYTLPKPVKYTMGGLAAIALAASATVGAYNYGREYVVEPIISIPDKVLESHKAYTNKLEGDKKYSSYPLEGRLLGYGKVDRPEIKGIQKIVPSGEFLNYVCLDGVQVDGVRYKLFATYQSIEVFPSEFNKRLDLYVLSLDGKKVFSRGVIHSSAKGVNFISQGNNFDVEKALLALNSHSQKLIGDTSILDIFDPKGKVVNHDLDSDGLLRFKYYRENVPSLSR